MRRQGARSKARRLGTIDLDSGEVFENGIPVWVNAKVRWGEDWFMGFQQAFGEVAADKDMSHQMTRVWLQLLSYLGFENYIAVEQSAICSALDMNRQNVSRAMVALVNKGLIIKGPKIGRSYSYRLNSKYAWKGKVVNLKKDRHESERERQKQMEEAWAEIDEQKRKDLIREAQERHFQNVQKTSSEPTP